MNTPPLTLSHKDAWEVMGIKRSLFYELLKAGHLDHLKAPIPFKFSRARVEAWINGAGVSQLRRIA